MTKAPITISLIVLVPLLAAGAGACASAPTAKPSDPGLAIPPAPPHVVPITTEPVLEPVGEIPGPSSPAASPATRGGRGSREAAPKPAGETKPEAKPSGEATETPAPVAPPPAPAAPPLQLRTAESPGTEGAIRAAIDRTRQLLSTVDYRHLTNVRKKAYDDAKKFADQADEALKQGNVVFALGVAGKAETLAKELANR